MPTLELPNSAHAPGISPVTIHYREFGCGKPLVILHGGWGYAVYPFDRQIAAFETQFRILIPDRSGYGRSTRVSSEMPLDFHRKAALETFSFLDALGIENAILWGHSDGAVIGAMMGLAAPERCASVVLEAFHYLRRKPGSRSFFERFAAHPEDLGDDTRKLLAEDHGETHWGELRVPVLFLHGSLDPRTEPGEMERVRQVLPQATIRFIANGKHSPHSEEEACQECNANVSEFFRSNT